MKVEGYWKTIALVFIVLSVIEIIVIGAIYFSAVSLLEGEDNCANYCEIQGHEAYYYDYFEERCSCYDGNHNVVDEPNLSLFK